MYETLEREIKENNELEHFISTVEGDHEKFEQKL
jgi:hypothetical protein